MANGRLYVQTADFMGKTYFVGKTDFMCKAPMTKRLINGYTKGYTNGITMRVAKRRWGEVTIKKQGIGKNKFDETKSFSIEQTETNYTVEEYYAVLKMVTDLTEKMKFTTLKRRLER